MTLFLIGLADGYLADVQGIMSDLGEHNVQVIDTENYEKKFIVLEELLKGEGEYIACPVPPGLRWDIADELMQSSLTPAAPRIHPSSSLDVTVTMGSGSTVNRLVAIGARVSVGHHSLINRSTSIGHHTRIGDFVTVGPGVTIASDVTLEEGSFIGAGAVLLPGVTIGKNAVVGAGSVVTRSVKPDSTVVGNPAAPIETEEPGFAGFRVP